MCECVLSIRLHIFRQWKSSVANSINHNFRSEIIYLIKAMNERVWNRATMATAVATGGQHRTQNRNT